MAMGLNEIPRAKDFILSLIQSVAARIKGQDHTVQEQFQCLLALFTRDITTMMSEVGIEFLATFGATKDQNVLKEMRKLYVSYKQRDTLLLESKKSILYSLIMKAIMAIWNQLPGEKVVRITDSTSHELFKELAQVEEGGLEKFKASIFESVETYARVRVTQ